MLGLLAKVGDAKTVMDSTAGSAVIKRGWAVIGDRPVVDAVGGYALAILAAQPAPRAPGATLYLPHVFARYRTEIEQVRRQMDAQLAQAPGDLRANPVVTDERHVAPGVPARRRLAEVVNHGREPQRRAPVHVVREGLVEKRLHLGRALACVRAKGCLDVEQLVLDEGI